MWFGKPEYQFLYAVPKGALSVFTGKITLYIDIQIYRAFCSVY
jgi:hypothetical protein